MTRARVHTHTHTQSRYSSHSLPASPPSPPPRPPPLHPCVIIVIWSAFSHLLCFVVSLFRLPIVLRKDANQPTNNNNNQLSETNTFTGVNILGECRHNVLIFMLCFGRYGVKMDLKLRREFWHSGSSFHTAGARRKEGKRTLCICLSYEWANFKQTGFRGEMNPPRTGILYSTVGTNIADMASLTAENQKETKLYILSGSRKRE